MSKKISLEEAIRTAIEFETRVREIYKEAEQQIGDAVGKRVMGALASEEQGHLDYLNSTLKEWQKDGTVSQKSLKTAVPPRDVVIEKTQELKGKLLKTPTDMHHNMELRMLRKALKVEEETSDFYKRMVSELRSEGQQLFARFVEIEEGHRILVQAEIDYVSGPGYWFDFKEFDLAGSY